MEPTKEAIQKELEEIESDLSPENLTCDGELSDEDVDFRYKVLIHRKQFLLKLLNQR
jgi:hypothetical protein